MNEEQQTRELMNSLEVCLQSADDLGLALVGIHLSQAIDILCPQDIHNASAASKNM